MKVIFTILFSSFFLIFYSQSIKQDQIIGSWEVVSVNNKIFTGGVITYFEFTEDQELIAKSINKKAHGEQKNEMSIGSYELQDELFILHRSINDLESDIICKVFFKEDNDTQLLVIEEYGSKNENEKINQVPLGNIKKTSVLKRFSKQ